MKNRRDFMTKYDVKAKKEVENAMHEMKKGNLRSGGSSQKKVIDPKQAIAIGLSKARKKGAKIPPLSNKSQSSS